MIGECLDFLSDVLDLLYTVSPAINDLSDMERFVSVTNQLIQFWPTKPLLIDLSRLPSVAKRRTRRRRINSN